LITFIINFFRKTFLEKKFNQKRVYIRKSLIKKTLLEKVDELNFMKKYRARNKRGGRSYWGRKIF